MTPSKSGAKAVALAPRANRARRRRMLGDHHGRLAHLGRDFQFALDEGAIHSVATFGLRRREQAARWRIKPVKSAMRRCATAFARIVSGMPLRAKPPTASRRTPGRYEIPLPGTASTCRLQWHSPSAERRRYGPPARVGSSRRVRNADGGKKASRMTGQPTTTAPRMAPSALSARHSTNRLFPHHRDADDDMVDCFGCHSDDEQQRQRGTLASD